MTPSSHVAWKSLFLSIVFGQAGIYPSMFPLELVYHAILVLALIKGVHIYKFYKANTGLMPLFVLSGIVDFSANVCTLNAFQTSSPLSVALIISTSVIFVMIFSIFIFKRRYGWNHLVASLIVILGIGLINYSKFINGTLNSDGTFWVGTLYALGAALGYAISNVVQEYLSLREDGYPIVTVGSMGLFGSVFSVIITQATLVGQQDRDSLIQSEDPNHYYIIGFILAMILFYFTVPLYFQKFSAIRFNFSMLTSDIYIYIYIIAAGEGNSFDGWYIGGFISVIVGLFVFNLIEPVEQDVKEGANYQA